MDRVRAELEFGPGARAEPFVSYCSVTRLLFEICGEEGYVYRIAERTSYFARLEEGLNNRAGFLIARKPAGMWWSVRTRPVSGSDEPEALTHWRAIGTLRSLTKEARIQLSYNVSSGFFRRKDHLSTSFSFFFLSKFDLLVSFHHFTSGFKILLFTIIQLAILSNANNIDYLYQLRKYEQSDLIHWPPPSMRRYTNSLYFPPRPLYHICDPICPIYVDDIAFITRRRS